MAQGSFSVPEVSGALDVTIIPSPEPPIVDGRRGIANYVDTVF